MCIAIVKPEGKWLRRKAARNCFDNNDDGAGFAWLQGGTVHVSKGYFGFRKFWKDFRKVQQYPCLVHFRIKTHGKTSRENCHPFEVDPGRMAMVHNGIISSLSIPGGTSDTAHFTDTVLKPLVKSYGIEALQVEDIQNMLQGMIGSGNKVATLDNLGRFTILNEKAGLWDEGIWWSNQSYVRTKYVTTYTTVSSGVNTKGKNTTNVKKTPTDWSKYKTNKDKKKSGTTYPYVAAKSVATKCKVYEDYTQEDYLTQQHRIVTGLHGQTVVAKVRRITPTKQILLSCMDAEEQQQVELYESTTGRYLSVMDILELTMISNAGLSKAITLEIRSRAMAADLD